MSFSRSTRSIFLLAAFALVAAAPVEAVKRRAFVTSVAGNGNLSSWPDAGGQTGLAAGDQICRARAAAAGLPNANAYRAWLSTATTDAFCHVQGLTGKRSDACNGAPLPGAGPWFLANGITNFTPSLDDLTGPERIIYRSVYFDENLDPLPQGWDQREYWTGTRSDGAAWTAATCGGWTSPAPGSSGTSGDGHGTAVRWSDSLDRACDLTRRLLCLEPGASETVILKWTPGAIVFVTSVEGSGALGDWPQAAGMTGINAGYQICRNLAEQAHLPEPSSFVPWLSTTLVDARDRLTTDGPFRRIDGYTVGSNAADLVDGSLDNSMHVLEDGSYLAIELAEVWTGTLSNGTVAGMHCSNWFDGSGAVYGRAGGANLAGVPDWTNMNGFVCFVTGRLYCISNTITLFWDGFDYTGDASRWSATVP